MAHFAEIDNNTKEVLRVLVVPNEQEHRGQEFLSQDLGLGGTWIQCSYNKTIRKNYPNIGDNYDILRDAFIPKKQHQQWILDEQTCTWKTPKSRPSNGKWEWSDELNDWVKYKD